MESQEVFKLKDKTMIARVLQEPGNLLRKYPSFGTWCYIISDGKELQIIDPGARYQVPTPCPRTCWKETSNLKRILRALDHTFPGQKTKNIIITHRHFDHSEIAPGLQAELGKRQGQIPEIRVHKKETERCGTGIINCSIEEVFSRAGYTDWKLGPYLKEGDAITRTGFKVKHMPGHTPGTIGLIDTKNKILISPYNPQHTKSKITRQFYKSIDSQYSMRERHCRWIKRLKGYKIYTTHPDI